MYGKIINEARRSGELIGYQEKVAGHWKGGTPNSSYLSSSMIFFWLDAY